MGVTPSMPGPGAWERPPGRLRDESILRRPRTLFQLAPLERLDHVEPVAVVTAGQRHLRDLARTGLGVDPVDLDLPTLGELLGGEQVITHAGSRARESPTRGHGPPPFGQSEARQNATRMAWHHEPRHAGVHPRAGSKLIQS